MPRHHQERVSIGRARRIFPHPQPRVVIDRARVCEHDHASETFPLDLAGDLAVAAFAGMMAVSPCLQHLQPADFRAENRLFFIRKTRSM